MTDYSKPTGFWCPTCRADYGRSHAALQGGFTAHDQLVCNGVGDHYHNPVETVPVFAEIPADQRPEADEPDDETVVTFTDDDTGQPWVGRCVRLGAHTPTWWGAWLRPSDVDGAVLWVACGVLP